MNVTTTNNDALLVHWGHWQGLLLSSQTTQLNLTDKETHFIQSRARLSDRGRLEEEGEEYEDLVS